MRGWSRIYYTSAEYKKAGDGNHDLKQGKY